MNKIILLSIFVASIFSCGAGVNDEYEELSGGYFYHRDGGYHSIIHNNYGMTIYSAISDYAYNDAFIIVEQIPNRMFMKSRIAGEILSSKHIFESYLTDSVWRKNEMNNYFTKERDSLRYISFEAKNKT